MASLPIDPLLPEIVDAVVAHPILVLEAPPGAGKTTRVPTALMAARKGRVLVSEPRRIAARLAATHVATNLGERVGETVGYRVRFEEACSEETRVLYVTEGVLAHQLLGGTRHDQPTTIVLDEFHERSLDVDLCLSLARRRLDGNPLLRLVVMSATLDGKQLSEQLGCPWLKSEGRAYPVEIEYAPGDDDRPLEKRVTSAVRSLLSEDATRSVLVFLPGAAEIRRAETALTPLARQLAIDVVPLHGELPLDAQRRAVSVGDRPRVVLATNVAESSITVEGVGAVVDSGLAREASHSPTTGRASLSVANVSRASCDQRAGRAGRTQPGRVVRLFTKGDYERREERTVPEILRTDLCNATLQLAARGIDPASLPWLDGPPPAALEAARRLLIRLDAIEAERLVPTKDGRLIAGYPVHPRLGRVLLTCARDGADDDAALAVAVLSERDVRARTHVTDSRGDSDVEECMDLYREAADSRFSSHVLRAAGLVASRVRSVHDAYRQLSRLARKHARDSREQTTSDSATLLRRALMGAFADRLARRSRPGSRSLVLRDGSRAQLSDDSVVHDGQFLVALDTDERKERGSLQVRLACSVSPEWILEDFERELTLEDETYFDANRQRVQIVSRIRLDSLVLEETICASNPSDEASEALYRAARQQVAGLFVGSSALESLLARYALVASTLPELGLRAVDTDDTSWLLRAACHGRTTLAEVRDVHVDEILLSSLSPSQRAAFERAAPATIRLPGGRTVPVHYEPNRPPWIASRLQDFFGTTRTPTLCDGRHPLTVQLLAPNQRPVQVTTDLASFWQRHYPELRKALQRRYPKHAWPEDGAAAQPPTPGSGQRGRR